MNNDQLTRRLFLQGSGSLAGSTLLRAAIPGVMVAAQAACTSRDEGNGFKVLAAEEAAEFAAIAARILPTTDTPGASEAGVIHFMDQAFGSFMQEDLANARVGLASLQATIGDQLFSSLDEARQDRQLTEIEDTSFFALMQKMTIYGFFGMQSYGGNIDNAGWKMLGIDSPMHAWQPPFGYYDAEYMRGEQNGE